MKWTVLLFVTALALHFQGGNRPAPAADEPLLRSTDLTYEGAFRLPSGPCAGDVCSVDYGGEAMSYSPAGDGGHGSLWVVGFASGHRVAEIVGLDEVLAAISPTHATFSALPVARKSQGWEPPLTRGDAEKVSPGAETRPGGIYRREDGTLLVNIYTYFGPASTHRSIFLASGNLAKPGTMGGPWEITGSGSASSGGMCGGGPNADGCRESFTSGPIEPVPANWQARLGGTHLVSGCCYPIISRTSYGPSTTVFNAADVGQKNPIVGTRLIGYPSASGFEHATLGNWDATNTGTKQWVGGTDSFSRSAVFAPGYRTLLFFGTAGTPDHFCYGPPVGKLDAHGGVYWPSSEEFAHGADASTDRAGTTITVPNADLRNVGTSGSGGQSVVWLMDQATPVLTRSGQRYTATAFVTDKGKSGTPQAYVKVGTPFPGGLTGQHYKIGERTCYDPPGRGALAANVESGHSPFAYPYRFAAWAYDLNDLAAVRAGKKRYWELVPYDLFTLNLTIKFPPTPGTERIALGGATYDPARRKIYLAQQWVDSNFNVAITVWSVAKRAVSSLPGF